MTTRTPAGGAAGLATPVPRLVAWVVRVAAALAVLDILVPARRARPSGALSPAMDALVDGFTFATGMCAAGAMVVLAGALQRRKRRAWVPWSSWSSRFGPHAAGAALAGRRDQLRVLGLLLWAGTDFRPDPNEPPGGRRCGASRCWGRCRRRRSVPHRPDGADVTLVGPRRRGPSSGSSASRRTSRSRASTPRASRRSRSTGTWAVSPRCSPSSRCCGRRAAPYAARPRTRPGCAAFSRPTATGTPSATSRCAATRPRSSPRAASGRRLPGVGRSRSPRGTRSATPRPGRRAVDAWLTRPTSTPGPRASSARPRRRARRTRRAGLDASSSATRRCSTSPSSPSTAGRCAASGRRSAGWRGPGYASTYAGSTSCRRPSGRGGPDRRRLREGEVERGFSMALGRLGDPRDPDLVCRPAATPGPARGVLAFVPWGRTGSRST